MRMSHSFALPEHQQGFEPAAHGFSSLDELDDLRMA